MSDTGPQEKQPILRAPAVVLVLLAVLVAFHLLSVFGGNAMRIELIVALGLFPARFSLRAWAVCPALGCRAW